MWKEENNQLKRSFEFANFIETYAFKINVAYMAEKTNENPIWINFYNKVEISLFSHNRLDIITEKDRKFAIEIDKIYKKTELNA
jgi:4a-hydroxytetrahydrobiopterin dehydratase